MKNGYLLYMQWSLSPEHGKKGAMFARFKTLDNGTRGLIETWQVVGLMKKFKLEFIV